ncbi:MAG: hypothetical protein FWJ65_12065, partial [Limnochordales bacterium]
GKEEVTGSIPVAGSSEEALGKANPKGFAFVRSGRQVSLAADRFRFNDSDAQADPGAGTCLLVRGKSWPLTGSYSHGAWIIRVACQFPGTAAGLGCPGHRLVAYGDVQAP